MVAKRLKKISFLMAVLMVVTMFPAYVLPVSAADVQVQTTSDVIYNTIDEAADYVKEQMIARETNITVQVSKSAVADNSSIAHEIMDRAVAYRRGDSGQAGDALERNRNGWSYWYGEYSGSYIISYTVGYSTNAEQEAQLTEAVNSALSGLNLEGKTTYEKIRSIYDYICDNVNYDYEGLNDDGNTIKYTAYGALINGKSVCQGYAVLFYRMCMDAGIPARVIRGYGNGGAHAWNIVEINGYYYNVDVTWDGQDSITTHNYFLKNMDDFSDHTRLGAFSTEEFNQKFPMAQSSYMDYGSIESPVNAINYDYTFTTIDGNSVNTLTYGKPKVLIFFSSSCVNSQQTIYSISNSDFKDVDIVYIDTVSSDSESATKNFRDSYGNNDMDFCAYTGWNSTAMWAYARNMPGYSGKVYWPVIAYIDSDNKLQMVTSGYSGAGTIRNYVNYYCYNVKSQFPHNHIYSDIWSMNSDGHWHDCQSEGCDGSVDAKAAHTAGEWIVDKAATVSETGSRHKECKVCGYVMQTEIIDKLTSTEPGTSEIDMDADTSKYYNVTTNGGTWNGTYYYLPSGQMVRNSFFSDGTYTYYLQADGTPMKDRLTYHPDGQHVIYLDADGHEVFSDFAHISKSIAGTDVDDMCFFNVYGYMYVDTLTYDKTGTKLYYVNPYGVLERNGWFSFSGREFDAGLGFSGVAGGYGYANSDCSLMINTNTYDWNGNFVYMQGDGHMAVAVSVPGV